MNKNYLDKKYERRPDISTNAKTTERHIVLLVHLKCHPTRTRTKLCMQSNRKRNWKLRVIRDGAYTYSLLVRLVFTSRTLHGFCFKKNKERIKCEYNVAGQKCTVLQTVRVADRNTNLTTKFRNGHQSTQFLWRKKKKNQ
jgi:hypothetical protein